MTGDGAVGDALDRLAGVSVEEQNWVLSKLTMPQKRELTERWWRHGHKGQVAPKGDWRIWLILAGRGFGKTRAGAEWLSQAARDMPDGRFALIGHTADDVRRVMIEGAAGLLAVMRDDERIVWRRERGEIEFSSGARAFVYSAEAPESLRGPEHHLAWCDELAKWRAGRAKDVWDNLQMGLRLGEHPRVLVTTTPKPGTLLRAIEREAEGSGSVMRGKTRDNPHLPQSFVAAMLGEYGGTRLGRQELDGELIDDVEGALWSRGRLEACRVKRRRARVVRVVVGVDPPAGSEGDACGIVAVALGADDIGYVVEDASVSGASPEGWAAAVAGCVARHKADRVVAEKNQGGDMVKSVLLAADTRLPLKLVHASRGKVTRAEPVATLYERGRMRHVGAFPALEDELCGLLAGGAYEGPGRSPDRADALVWAATELMLGRRAIAGVRGL
ncbi:terminase family protein [uncultured Sphingomonas sp.]|uniref:DNA-packaging protein n=1 Tax=uncultured Sphingomonas sp. TaxID=158754 RepID=UPI0025CB8B56|nr:terminase family protein [uncultured Sphingomonas sp.]